MTSQQNPSEAVDILTATAQIKKVSPELVPPVTEEVNALIDEFTKKLQTAYPNMALCVIWEPTGNLTGFPWTYAWGRCAPLVEGAMFQIPKLVGAVIGAGLNRGKAVQAVSNAFDRIIKQITTGE